MAMNASSILSAAKGYMNSDTGIFAHVMEAIDTIGEGISGATNGLLAAVGLNTIASLAPSQDSVLTVFDDSPAAPAAPEYEPLSGQHITMAQQAVSPMLRAHSAENAASMNVSEGALMELPVQAGLPDLLAHTRGQQAGFGRV